jgi:hypothetical protein
MDLRKITFHTFLRRDPMKSPLLLALALMSALSLNAFAQDGAPKKEEGKAKEEKVVVKKGKKKHKKVEVKKEEEKKEETKK